LSVKQEGSVEDYTRDFEAIQYQVSIFNAGFDEMFFTSHFVNGLKEEIKVVVQPQLPDIVDKGALLARIQQQALGRNKSKSTNHMAPRVIQFLVLLLVHCGRNNN
jgi:hypothetical protein